MDLYCAHAAALVRGRDASVYPGLTTGPRGHRLSLPPVGADAQGIVVRAHSGRDSDLEAFSHNPSDGSLAPLPYRAST